MTDIEKVLAEYKTAMSAGDYPSATAALQPLFEHADHRVASHAHYLAGVGALELGVANEALCCFNSAIEKNNSSPGLYELCWKIYFQSEDYINAGRVLELGLQRCGRSGLLLAQMGSLEARLGNYSKAEKLLQEALVGDGDCVLALNNLGSLYETIGRVDDALSCFQKALLLEPENTIAISNLLLTLNYTAIGKKSLFQAHQLYCIPIKPSVPPPVRKKISKQKVRVGYLSSDFRFHAVAFFIFPILSCHDHSNFEIFCYADNSSQDDVTELLKSKADYWRDVSLISDQKLAQQFADDGIDILIDLSGHSLGRRLALLKSKSVPHQVSYLGYPNTVGLKEVDYRLVDEITDPVGGDDDYCLEKLYRLESPFLCYWPIGKLPDITDLPANENGYITFGSFNRLSKISDVTVKLWSALLSHVPGSKLLIKTRALDDQNVAIETLDRFKCEGVDAARIILEGGSQSHFEYLKGFSKVDVSLDTAPYNGTTTTCNSLIMGVPVLTVRGDRHGARVSASILESLSMSNMIADGPKDFLRIGKEISESLGSLQVVRGSLRQTVLDSPLTDGVRLAKEVETFYLSLMSG